MTRQPPPPQTPADGLVCLGIVTGTHGVRGAVRVKTFTDDPLGLGNFGALRDASGKRRYVVRDIQPDKTGARLMLEHITTREQAAALKGKCCAFRATRCRRWTMRMIFTMPISSASRRKPRTGGIGHGARRA